MIKQLLLTLLLATAALNAAQCTQHYPSGLPITTEDKTDQLLCNSKFAVGYSYRYKSPLFTAHVLTKEQAQKRAPRKGYNWKEERRVPARYRAHNYDYKSTHYAKKVNRGHMVPYADLDDPHSRRAANESFVFSNAVIQNATMNQQAWQSVEKITRALVKKFGKIEIITGAIYKNSTVKSPNGVIMPTHLYKAIYAPTQKKMWAFLMPNVPVSKKQAYQYRVSVDDVEAKAGIDLFSTLSKQLQKELESQRMAL